MMTKLLTVKDVQVRYQCGANTARKYMRQMRHLEKPLMVSTEALEAWERDRTYPGEAEIRESMRDRVRRANR